MEDLKELLEETREMIVGLTKEGIFDEVQYHAEIEMISKMSYSELEDYKYELAMSGGLT